MTRPAQPPPASPAGKLRFSIHFCSGEDPDYPARELLYHSAHTRGWQTPRFCRYPQELVLRLDRPSRIQQIQILSHEYKISQRLEIFVASPAPGEDPSRAAFKRLGHLSFHSNEKTNYQARELKTVHISHAAALVKFSLAGPHMNQHNIYNQVCLIAINLLGDPLPDAPGGAYDPAAAPYPNAVAALRDFAAEMNVDSVTAAQIRELEAEKGRAVAAEDYDRAKQIKVAVDRLKDVGRKVAQLEAKKRAAVEREDYDEAKRLKADIDKLRQAGPSATLAEARGPEGVMGALDRLDLQEGPAGHARAPPVNHDDVPVGPAAGSGAGFGPEGEGMGPDDIPAAPTPRAVQARPPPPEMGPDSVPAAPPPAMPGVGTKVRWLRGAETGGGVCVSGCTGGPAPARDEWGPRRARGALQCRSTTRDLRSAVARTASRTTPGWVPRAGPQPSPGAGRANGLLGTRPTCQTLSR